MSTPNWLDLPTIHHIHSSVLEQAGGSGGIRDKGLLESALARPKNIHAYGGQDIFQLAASYAEGLARNHPFVDGNKRTAFAAAVIFLQDHGHALEPGKNDNHARMMESLAQGKITLEEAGQYFKAHAVPVS